MGPFTVGDLVLELVSLPFLVWLYSIVPIQWFFRFRRGSLGDLQQKARDDLEDFEEFLWCLDLGMDNMDGTVIKEV